MSDIHKISLLFRLILTISLGPLVSFAEDVWTPENTLKRLYADRELQYDLFEKDEPVQVIRPEMFHPQRGREYYSQDPKYKGYIDLNGGLDPGTLNQLGGDWGSSGGDGVVCYADADQLRKAQQELAENGILSKQTLRSAESAYAQEVFEYLVSKDNFLAAKEELMKGSPQRIGNFERITEKSIPAIWNHLNAMKALYPVNQWIVSQPMDVPDSEFHVEESGATQESEKNQQWEAQLESRNCHLVQTVLRISQRSVDGHRPKGWFFYNPYIYHEKFSDISRYVMQLHEYLYFMMTTTGHRDSYWVRKAIKELVLEDSSASKKQNIFWYVLGDYQILWSKTLTEIAQKPEYEHLLSTRFYSDYVSMVKAVRDSGVACRESHGDNTMDQGELKRHCSFKIVEDTDHTGRMTPPQAFFFVSHFYLQQITRQMNASALGTFDQVNPGKSESHWRGTARTACTLMPNLLRGTVEGDVRSRNFNHALKFCEEMKGQL